MKLIKFTIENFRSYREPVSIDIASMTALVGRNDIGKSTILEALDIFFNEAKPDSSDLPVGSESKIIKFTCLFSGPEDRILLDAENVTSLSEEMLLTADGHLEIIKEITIASKSSPIISINAYYPHDEKISGLVNKKIPELRRLLSELSIATDDVKKNTSASIRKAILASYSGLEKKMTLIPLSGEDGKNIADKIKNHFPAFHLFKADRQSTDKDTEAQDPMKAAIKEALSDLSPQLDEIINSVKNRVSEVATATANKLRELNVQDLALEPIFSSQDWSKVFSVSLTGEDQVPLNKRGSGTRRLALLAFFQAEAERLRDSRTTKNIILAVEEPETALHPRMQEELMEIFDQLTKLPGYQIIITTHNPALAKLLPYTAIRYIDQDVQGKRIVHSGDTACAKCIHALGILASHNVKVFFCVEGRNDIDFWKNISKALHAQESAKYLDLEAAESAGDLIFIPMGGSTLDLWASRLKGLQIPELHVIDRDADMGQEPKESQVNLRQEVVARSAAGYTCLAHITDCREIENLLHIDAIKKIEEYKTLPYPMFTPSCDIPTKIAMAVHNQSSPNSWDEISSEKQKEKESRVKKKLAKKATLYMTPDLLRVLPGAGLVDDVFAFLKEQIK